MKELFIPKSFQEESMLLLDLVNQILDEYSGQGFDLSLRQLYYQLVSRDLLPKKWADPKTGSTNNIRAYKNLGNLINDARLAGYVDWNMIVDRGRHTVHNSHWTSPADILESAAYSFKIDKWKDQPYHCEVMVEKDALSGVLVPVCKELDVRFTANKGYPSSSILYSMSKRLNWALEDGKDVIIFHLGDHDPSGIDMTRDLVDRLELFCSSPIKIERLALNMDQVERYNPPENPAKTTDSRSDNYISLYGSSSWELDALEPSILAGLVRSFIYQFRDDDIYQETLESEQEMKNDLENLAQQYRRTH